MTTEPFLSRWMRRKVVARQGESVPPHAPAPAPVKAVPAAASSSAPAVAPAPSASTPPPELPTLESLQGLVSEYRGFMHADVAPGMQRAALKKLFSDPHFNIMDGLDVYIDDYGIPDPIPPAMLASLQQAQSLLFNDVKEQPDGATPSEQAEHPVEIATAGEEELETSEPAVTDEHNEALHPVDDPLVVNEKAPESPHTDTHT